MKIDQRSINFDDLRQFEPNVPTFVFSYGTSHELVRPTVKLALLAIECNDQEFLRIEFHGTTGSSFRQLSSWSCVSLIHRSVARALVY